MTERPRWEVEGRDWPLREHSRFVTVGRIVWHVQMLGSGPVALLLHGTGAATHSWRDVAPLLAGRFTVVMPDLPGHGFTRGRPAAGLTLPAMAQAMKSLVDSLGLAPALAVGQSAGAAIALRMALDRTLTGPIIGFAAALLPFPGLAAQLFPALAKLLFVNPFAPRMFARIAQSPGEVERFLARSTGSRIDRRGVDLYARLLATPGHCAGALDMMAGWDLPGLATMLPAVPVPTLLVHGDHDAAIPIGRAREAAARIPQARLEVMNRAGHLAHEERPDEAAAAIVRFATDHAILTPAAKEHVQ